MLEKIFIFIIFLGPLIFFHELGHYFFARLFGVRVEVFSMGFGPKIFKYVHKGTEYVLSIIPLGGYVKMFGDDPLSEVELSEDEKKVAFTHKSKWARFWIVFGGPLANFILAYCLYLGLIVGGEKVPEPRIGYVPQKSVFYQKGLRSGDILSQINSEPISSFDDLNIKSSLVETMTVLRGEEKLTLNIDLKFQPFIQAFTKIVRPLREPIVVDKSGHQYVLTLDKIDQEKALTFFNQPHMSLEEIDSQFKGEAFLYRLIEKNMNSNGAENDAIAQGDEFKNLSIDLSSEQHILLSKNSKEKNSSTISTENGALFDLFKKIEFFPSDLIIGNIVMGGAADKVQLKKDDILVSVGGSKMSDFEELRKTLQALKDDQSIDLEIYRQGKLLSFSLQPEVKEINGVKRRLIGVESYVKYIKPQLIEVKSKGLFEAVILASTRTWDGAIKTFSGYKKLITREVSLNNIGGPLAIGKVASDSFNVSLSMFFRLMAIISINLGMINLFPIPVLDGGHIMFLFFELINGGPLSRRKLEFAQRLGLSLLLALIFVALFNDVSKILKF